MMKKKFVAFLRRLADRVEKRSRPVRDPAKPWYLIHFAQPADGFLHVNARIVAADGGGTGEPRLMLAAFRSEDLAREWCRKAMAPVLADYCDVVRLAPCEVTDPCNIMFIDKIEINEVAS
jgi:hypothetical protein